MAEVIAGLRFPAQGQIFLEGENITNFSPGDLIDRMLSCIPEERIRDGSISNFSIPENMILREHHKHPYSQNGFLKLKNIEAYTDLLIKQFQVKTTPQRTFAKSLSGGNIQKVILARELTRNPRIIIAAQPTRGMGIGATEYMPGQLITQRNQGTAGLLISEDLDEIITLSDRIAVKYESRIMDVQTRREATRKNINLLMAGVKPDENSVEKQEQKAKLVLFIYLSKPVGGRCVQHASAALGKSIEKYRRLSIRR